MSSFAAHHLSARPAVARRATLSRRTAGERAPVRTRVRSPAVAAADTENLPANLKKIVSAFHDNKVPGCVSQVWVVPRIEDGLVYFTADSDSQLTKGLAALLVEGLSGSTPKEIMAVEPNFVELLGLGQSLTPSRTNGFMNMLRLMQKKTLEAYMAAEAAAKE